MNIEHRTSNIECLMGKDEETEEFNKIAVTTIETDEKKAEVVIQGLASDI